MITGTIRLSGLMTGLDTDEIIQRILDVERLPVTNLQNKKSILTTKSDAISAIKSSLSTLKTKIANLKDSIFYDSKAATSSDATVATAVATTSAVSGTYKIDITDLATATALKSGTVVGDKVASAIDPTALLNADAAYGSSLTLGTFTVNGATVTIDGTDTVNSALAKISAATGGVVTGVYNAGPDTITLTSSGPNLILGGANDTSNFLSRSRLYTPTPASITTTSLTSMGTIDTTKVIGTAGSRVAGFAGLTTGTITVNGVSVNVDKDVDTLQNVLDRITASTAGVYATYDSIEDRIVLTSKTTGSIGISVADGSSNFASSLKLTSAASQTTVGKDTTFTVNGGSVRKSTDAIITETESGVTGLTITALKSGAPATTTFTVGTDTSRFQSEVQGFVDQYNSVQNIIKSYMTAPDADEDYDPAASSSILIGDSTVSSIPGDLRRIAGESLSSGTYRMLEDIGVVGSGDNNLLTFSDTAKFATAIATNPNEVESILTTLSNDLDSYLDTQIDAASGLLTSRTDTIATEQDRIDDSIESMETLLASREEQLIAAFTALEQYQAVSNNILSFLQMQRD
ncbi:MAG: flagellar filament capping protein FliD [Verrucomicrobia bacterium]|nr:flagellar filament capping protein FliD [Verrucomicrobiota bacterium]